MYLLLSLEKDTRGSSSKSSSVLGKAGCSVERVPRCGTFDAAISILDDDQELKIVGRTAKSEERTDKVLAETRRLDAGYSERKIYKFLACRCPWGSPEEPCCFTIFNPEFVVINVGKHGPTIN